ncbi:EamA family transporter [Cereibacter changlensis JA139]|uniref:EamA family transporter n=2 Tax=Cereibacter changlensis TaxID=402884 RepID=A0A2T4JVD6_9RHOB|nr:DMT family transporter [Cereibacter changlensis]PTE21879.1 EamA family transporter [Cereibacter changlensis JA139]PZX51623.1 EamA domain-containing membrane protein RarD [Cereibacter changlensis]
MHSTDRILPGVALMLAFCVLAPLLDVSSKLASATIPVGQITTARFLVQAALMLPVVLVMRLGWRMSRGLAGMILLRAVFLILSTYSFVAAVQVMPIADALAIAFVEPFILLILGKLLFGDEVGPRRIAASVVGFGGALLVIQPSLAAFGLVALWPLGTAFFFSFYMLATRQISRSMHPVTMQLHTSLAGLVILLPLMLAADLLAIPTLDPVMPRGLDWLWLFGVGFWAALSHMCMTYALKFAPSATLAPLHYLEIVAAVGLGYAVFGDFPNAMTWAGIGVITGSGLYIIARERAVAQGRVLPAPAR